MKPYPDCEEEVAYRNRAAGIELAATLTIDESLLGHKPFLTLSDYLTRKGIVVLRSDERGTAKSAGNFPEATTADFATDREGAVASVNKRPEAAPYKTG